MAKKQEYKPLPIGFEQWGRAELGVYLHKNSEKVHELSYLYGCLAKCANEASANLTKMLKDGGFVSEKTASEEQKVVLRMAERYGFDYRRYSALLTQISYFLYSQEPRLDKGNMIPRFELRILASCLLEIFDKNPLKNDTATLASIGAQYFSDKNGRPINFESFRKTIDTMRDTDLPATKRKKIDAQAKGVEEYLKGMHVIW